MHRPARAIGPKKTHLSAIEWFALLLDKREAISHHDELRRTVGRIGRYNCALAAFDGSAPATGGIDAIKKGLTRALDDGLRASGLVLVVSGTDTDNAQRLAQSLVSPEVDRARDRMAAHRKPWVVILAGPTSLHVAETLASTADVVLAEATIYPPGITKRPLDSDEAIVDNNGALKSGCADQVVERGRLRGVVGCLFDSFEFESGDGNDLQVG